jgi:predicted ArsR family transcriptional regulator
MRGKFIMVVSSMNARLEKPAGARDRIVSHLIKHQSTVESLATSLGVTKNAVRAQIALLQRGIVWEIQGEVKGTRRPAAVYGIRPARTFISQEPIRSSSPILLVSWRRSCRGIQDRDA